VYDIEEMRNILTQTNEDFDENDVAELIRQLQSTEFAFLFSG